MPIFWGGAGSPSEKCGMSEAYLHIKWHLDLDGPKLGVGCAPVGEGQLGSNLTKCGTAEACLHAKFILDPSNCLAIIRQRYRQNRETDRQDSPIAIA